MKKLFAIIASIALLTGCYKSKFSDIIPPDEGLVRVNIVLPTLAAGDPKPSSYTIVIGDNEGVTTHSDGITTYPTTLAPGDYYIYVYSNSTSVAMDDRRTTDGTIIATAHDDGANVKSLPEHIYFGSQRITIVANTMITADVAMVQISRDIHFNLQITEGDPDRISSISSSLNGVTQAWECIGNTALNTALTTIDPALVQGASIVRSAVDNDYITGSIRVFGVSNTPQILTINLTFNDSKTQKIESDISSQLTDSNDNEPTDITLTGDIHTPIAGGTGGSIDNWGEVNGEPQIVK